MDPEQQILPHFQQLVDRFVAENNLEAPIPARLLDLVSEVGELAKEALTGSKYGQAPFVPSAAWEDELADCFFSLVCLANSSGLDLERALEGTLDKCQRRLSARGEPGSGR